MQGVFNPNILIYHPPNSAEGLLFSAFHYLIQEFIIELVDSISRDERGFTLKQYITNGHPYLSTVWMTEIWMTILESAWNLWVWLVGAVSRRWVWLVGGIYGYGYHV